jgi:hypothetical protein
MRSVYEGYCVDLFLKGCLLFEGERIPPGPECAHGFAFRGF